MEEGLANLTNLRKLGIFRLSTSRVQILLDSVVVRSDCLRSLKLSLDYPARFPDLEPLSLCHHLLKLKLKGKLEKLPQWPPNLTKLTLDSSELQQDPMTMLQNLPNLISLSLSLGSYEGEEMVCSAKGFPQLQFLKLLYLFKLEEWRVEEGVMPSLRHLKIRGCDKLRMVPEGLRSVATLRELDIITSEKNSETGLEQEERIGTKSNTYLPSQFLHLGGEETMWIQL